MGLPLVSETYAPDRGPKAPVMWHPIEGSEGFWALTRYDDVRAANLDAKTFSSQKGGILMSYLDEARRHPLLHRASLDTMICLDPLPKIQCTGEAEIAPNSFTHSIVKLQVNTGG